MTEPETVERSESGFELGGRFYRWAISDTGKDLMLIDRFTGLPVNVFFELLEDEAERGRSPIILSMVACSVRAGNPEWSVERIVRLLMDTPLSEIVMIDSDTEEQAVPPVQGGETEPPPSSLSAVESSPSATPAENFPSPISSETLPFSTPHGLPTSSLG